jgi:hypothetical protein
MYLSLYYNILFVLLGSLVFYGFVMSFCQILFIFFIFYTDDGDTSLKMSCYVNSL